MSETYGQKAASAEYRQGFGTAGADYVGSTVAQSGQTWACIYVLADAVFSALTAPDLTGTMTSVTIPAGTPLYIKVTAFTLASGKVLAYRDISLQ